MNTKSIRFRLTIWYSLIFIIGTALMFVVFYLVTKQTLLYKTDQELTLHADALVHIIQNSESLETTGKIDNDIIAHQFSEMPGMLVVITDALGKITASSQKGAENDHVINDMLKDSFTDIEPTFVDRTIGSSILRIGIFPINNNGKVQGQVLMGDPIDAIYNSLNSLLLSLIVFNLLLSIPAILGGHFFSRKAMEPVSTISKKLVKITSDNLNERVAVPKTGDELEELATTFNNLFDRIAQAFSRERQFIGDVAHELKSPVAILKSEIELTLSKERTAGEYKETLNETLIDVNRLSSTVENILDLAWLGAKDTNRKDKQCNLSDTLIELKEIAIKLSATKHIRIEGTIEPHVTVMGVEDKLSRAILNVIDNAIKYSPQEGLVVITLGKKNERALLEVKDFGVGISKQELSHIFERFYRGSKTDKTQGSGLGLAITKEIIQAHKGEITVSSKVGKGTVIVITLPLSGVES